MSKLLRALLITIICLVLFAGGLFAYTVLLDYPCEFSVIPGNEGIIVYVDPELTMPAHTKLYWSNIPRGSELTTEYYVYNITDQDKTVGVKIEPTIWFADITFEPSTPVVIPAGEAREFVQTTVVSGVSELGTFEFRLIFYSP